MTKITPSLGALLLIGAMSCNAFADPGRGHFYRHAPARHGNASWIAPLVFLGIAGAVVGAAASQNSAPTVVHVPPPVTYAPPPVAYAPPPLVYAPPSAAPARPASNAWYFCQSVGQYYPHTPHCPEGWQAVYPPQR
ncbi:MAG: hypothetical protein K9K38_04805 [Rhodoferax sp.]|nr:hypothetical protein [Rhodoferax sp.]